MKLFTTPALKNNYEANAFVAQPLSDGGGYEFKWWFCFSGMSRLFDLPAEDTVKTIWLEFHDRPADDRVSYKMVDEYLPNEDSLVAIDGDAMVVSGFTARWIEKQFDSPRTLCYVGCYYK